MDAIDSLITKNRQIRIISEKKIEILDLVSDLMSLIKDVYTEILGTGITIILPYNLIKVSEQGDFASCLTTIGGDPDKSLLIIIDKDRKIKYSIMSILSNPNDLTKKKIPVSKSEFTEKQLPEIIKELKKTRGQ
jgi:hypothetical protein